MKMDGLIIVYNILCAVRNFIIDHFNKITSTFKYKFILVYLARHSKGIKSLEERYSMHNYYRADRADMKNISN
tara:strand:- start:503 stop:721 length:219 start_codon:yes stop_codon:yes gene_type:complete